MPQAQQPDALQDGRVEWAKQMRLAFSPGGMLLEDGTINQAFFKPKTVRLPPPMEEGLVMAYPLKRVCEAGSTAALGQAHPAGCVTLDVKMMAMPTPPVTGRLGLSPALAGRVDGWVGHAKALRQSP